MNKPADALLSACRVASSVGTLTLRANGAAITDAIRDQLLAKCAAGEYVELDVELLAFEQRPGVANRNYVRFSEQALEQLSRTAAGKPFIRDHEQNDILARAGTITRCETVRAGGGHQLRMTVKLTAPWAVELAARGLLSSVSIGWHPTGPIECSACDAEVFTKCRHYPGAQLEKGRAEWRFTSVELVETSLVSVPAVPAAQIDGIRATLAAAGFPIADTDPQPQSKTGTPPAKGPSTMSTPHTKPTPEQIEADMVRLAREAGMTPSAFARTDRGRDLYSQLSAAQIEARRTPFARPAPGAPPVPKPQTPPRTERLRAEAELSAAIDRYAAQHKLPRSAASVAFCRTDEGRQLYAKANAFDADAAPFSRSADDGDD